MILLDPECDDSVGESPMYVGSYGPGNVILQDVTSEFLQNGYDIKSFIVYSYFVYFEENPDKFSEIPISST